MLKKLKLKNLALIEIIEINFEKGLNVFTGESGSGKSLILDSLNSLFGGSNIPINHLIRPDTNECLIEARFDCSKEIRNWLLNNGFKIDTNEIIISRKTFKNQGKIYSNFKINDLKINKKLIKLLGAQLIDFAGQSDTTLFGSEEYLRTIINDLGSSDLKNINCQVKKIWAEMVSLKNEIKVKSLQIDKEEEHDFANEKLLKILEESNLNNKDEIFELKSKELKLANNFDLCNAIQNSLKHFNSSLIESPSVNSLIYDSIKELSKVSKYDLVIDEYLDKLITIQKQIDEIIYLFSEYLNNAQNDDNQLSIVQKRLFDLQNLEKTFSLELPELINKRDELRSKKNITCKKEELRNLNSDFLNLNKTFKKLLFTQSILRKRIAGNLEKSVVSKLNDLGLKNAVFKIDFKSIEPNSEGQDRIRFLFSANPDQKPAPINKVISGGEMSRFLLALKASISFVPDVLFFDEIDNGLSGKSLNCLLSLIKMISENKQVLCITHQPLLAASSNTHFKVEKQLNHGKTFTFLTKLVTKEQKQKQLAELIGVGSIELTNYAITLLNREAA